MPCRQFELIACFLILLAGHCALAGPPRMVGILYECEVAAVFPGEEGQLREELVPAVLILRFSDSPETSPAASLEIEWPKEAILLKVLPEHITPVAKDVFDQRGAFLFAPVEAGFFPAEGKVTLDLSETSGSPAPNAIRSSVKIVDARGNPAEGFEVELLGMLRVPSKEKYGKYIDYTYYSLVLGPSGDFPIVVPRELGEPFLPSEQKAIADYGLKLMVRDPASGQRQEFRYAHSDTHSAPNLQGVILDTIHLALLAGEEGEKAEAAPDVFRGELLDDQGAPVENVRLGWYGFQATGFAGESGLTTPQGAKVILCEQGRFRFSVPRDMLMNWTGQMQFPPEGRVILELSPQPQGQRSLGHVKRYAYAGQKARIVFPYSEMFAFVFLDDAGVPIEDQATRGYAGTVMLRRVEPASGEEEPEPFSEELCFVVYPQNIREDGAFRVGPVPVPADYEAEYGGRRYLAQRLEAGRGEESVEWLPAGGRLIFKGRVLDARSGFGLPGARVSLPRRSASVWTDAYGAYSIAAPRGQRAYFVEAGAPGMIRMRSDSSTGCLGAFPEPEVQEGTFVLPDAPLIPAATVVVRLATLTEQLPDPFLRERPEGRPQAALPWVQVSFEPLPSWSCPVGHGWEVGWDLIHCPELEELEPGRSAELPVQVPAGVSFSLGVAWPYERLLQGMAWEDLGPLAEGQTLVLATAEVSLKRPFLVQVLNADGTLAPGLGIAIDGGYYRALTDEAGTAIGWAGDRVKSLRVYSGLNPKCLAEKLDFELPEGDEATVVEIVLPEEASR